MAAQSPRTYLLATGITLAIVAALGFALVATGNARPLGAYLAFDTPHNVLHAALAAAALVLALAPLGARRARETALGFGIFSLALAVLGLINGDLFGYPERLGWSMHFELGENLLHLGLGGWGAYVGTLEND